MAFDDALAERLRDRLRDAAGVHEKKMFGGLAFLTDGNMTVGVHGDDMIVRIAPDDTPTAVVNWPEVAWSALGRLRQQLARAPLAEELHELVTLAETAVADLTPPGRTWRRSGGMSLVPDRRPGDPHHRDGRPIRPGGRRDPRRTTDRTVLPPRRDRRVLLPCPGYARRLTPSNGCLPLRRVPVTPTPKRPRRGSGRAAPPCSFRQPRRRIRHDRT